MNTVQFSKVILISLALVACASPPKVRVDKDASVNLSSYKTFGWLAAVPVSSPGASNEPAKPEAKAETKSDAVPEVKREKKPAVDSLIDNRVHAAIITALQAKGYTLNETNPDFRVSYVLSVYERPKDSGMRIGIGAGGSSGNVGGGVGFSIPIGKRTNMIGAMTIDMIDSVRNAQVWTGAYEEKIQDNGQASVGDEDAKKLINTILEKYPSKTAAQ